MTEDILVGLLFIGIYTAGLAAGALLATHPAPLVYIGIAVSVSHVAYLVLRGMKQ